MNRCSAISKMTFALLTSLFVVACDYEASELKGIKDAAIVGGTEVEKVSPLATSVALLFNRMTTEVCTVSILNNQFALTAAHCVVNAEAKNLYLVFDTELKKDSVTRRVVSRKATTYYNPKATRLKNTGDIALVRFAGGVPPGYTAAKFLGNPTMIADGATVTVVGYGVNNDRTRTGAGTLRTTDIPILNSNYSETEVTLDQAGTMGVCHGDSGGPVYSKVNGTEYLWGVVSRSVNPDNCSEAAIVTDSLVYFEWIKQTIGQMAKEKLIPPADDGPLFDE